MWWGGGMELRAELRLRLHLRRSGIDADMSSCLFSGLDV